jgi:hypothetical protein
MDTKDTFRLISEETAGAIIGAVVAALVVYDLLQRFREWAVG